MHKTIILSVVLYGCETLEEHRLRVRDFVFPERWVFRSRSSGLWRVLMW